MTNSEYYNDEIFNNIKTEKSVSTLSTTLPLKPSTTLPVNYLEIGEIAYDEENNTIMFCDGFIWEDLGTGGGVTQVNTGTGLTGGPITTTGTISIADIGGITPGTYTNVSVTVNAQGQITIISNGVAPITTIESMTNTITPTDEGNNTWNVDVTPTTVIPGSYVYTSMTVNVYGQLTAASSAIIPDATPSSVGKVFGYTNSIISNTVLGENGSILGANNTIMGYNSGTSLNGSSSNNTICGGQSGTSLTSGTDNTIYGANTGNVLTIGTNNIMVGSNCCSAIGPISGSNNVVVGSGAGMSGDFSNCVVVGSNATSTASGQFVLGSSSNALVTSTAPRTSGAIAVPANANTFLQINLNGTLLCIPCFSFT